MVILNIFFGRMALFLLCRVYVAVFDLGDQIGDRNLKSKFALQIAAKPLQIAEWLL